MAALGVLMSSRGEKSSAGSVAVTTGKAGSQEAVASGRSWAGRCTDFFPAPRKQNAERIGAGGDWGGGV